MVVQILRPDESGGCYCVLFGVPIFIIYYLTRKFNFNKVFKNQFDKFNNVLHSEASAQDVYMETWVVYFSPYAYPLYYTSDLLARGFQLLFSCCRSVIS